MRQVPIGQTDYTVVVKITDITGAEVVGLVNTDIDIAYLRVETDNDVTTSDVTPASLSALTDAHTDWGFKEISATDHPGLYRLDVADAVFAAGAWEAVVTITDASGTDFYSVDVGFRLGPVEANMTQIDSDTSAAVGLSKAARCIAYGTVTTGATTTSIPTSSITPAGIDPNQFIGLVMKFPNDTTTTGIRGEGRIITGFNDSNDTFTTEAFSTAPVSGDLFVVN